MFRRSIIGKVPFIKHFPGPRKICRVVRNCIGNAWLDVLMYFNVREYADCLYKRSFGCRIDWDNPRNLNEWINYFAFCTDTSMWTDLTDKYEVRRFVENKGLPELLIPLYGKWGKTAEIDFDSLPDSFVLKTNCSSGDAIIVPDKSLLNVVDVKEKLNKSLSERDRIFRKSAEIHYLRIKQLIVCEELIQKPYTTDYKFWCFNGEPFCVLVCANRDIEAHSVDLVIYDLDWNRHPEWLTDRYQNDIQIDRPFHLTEMIDYARQLSQGFPEVRVDFYDTPKRVLFGEMTFTSYQGRMPYFTSDALKVMGNLVAKGYKNKNK